METVQLHLAEAGLQCDLRLRQLRQAGLSTSFVFRDRVSHIVKQDRDVIGSIDRHDWMAEMQVECLVFQLEKCLVDTQEYVYSELELGMPRMSLLDQAVKNGLV